MLNRIRRNVRHPYIQALLGLVILVFIFFFGWSMRSQKPTHVAEVNGEPIDVRAYQQAYNGLVRVYSEAYQGDLTPERIRQLGLGRRALDQLIDQVLLMEEAEHRGIEVSDQELQAAIESVPAFGGGQGFSKARYLQVLEANRMTPLEYEQAKRQEVLLQRVEQSIRSEATVTEQEVEQEYRDRNTKVDLEFATFRPADFEAEVSVTDDALRGLYEEEKESLRRPEERVGRYTVFRPEEFVGDFEATEEEIREEYAWRATEFSVPEAVRARHILFRVPPDATEEEEQAVRARAEAVRKEILDGADFAEMAKRVSEDPGSKNEGGDLGLFERGKMVPEFEQAAFALQVGTLSEPVKTPFGYHLILVEEHRPAAQKTLEEVSDVLAADIKRRKALEAAYSAADNTLMDLEDGVIDWASLAEKREVLSTDPVERSGPLEGIDKPDEFRDALFAMDPEKPGELLETPEGTYLFAVAEVIPSEIPPFAEVRDEIESRYREREARHLAETRAQEFLTRAREDGWAQVAEEGGVRLQSTGPFTKKGGAIPKIGWSPELKEAAFGLTEDAPILEQPYEVNGALYAAHLASRTEADLTGLEGQREEIRTQLLPQKQSEYFQSFLAELRAKADIEINEELLY